MPLFLNVVILNTPMRDCRQEKLVKKALGSTTTNALLVCSGTPMVAEPVVHPKVRWEGRATEQDVFELDLKYHRRRSAG